MLATAQKSGVCVKVSWMLQRDMPEVLAIERQNFEFPWSEDDFIRTLRWRNCLGLTAEHEDKIAGFTIYELCKDRIHILNIAVRPSYQRQGVGSQIISKLISKLSAQRRPLIVSEVRETNLAAQLFFRKCGFRAISVLRGCYQDTQEDAYVMEYRRRSTTPDQNGGGQKSSPILGPLAG